jgi:hypothetical protein
MVLLPDFARPLSPLSLAGELLQDRPRFFRWDMDRARHLQAYIHMAKARCCARSVGNPR